MTYLYVEDGLASLRRLLSIALLIILGQCIVIGLALLTVLLSPASPLHSFWFGPEILFEESPRTEAIAAFILTGTLCGLGRYTLDALNPGSGKPWARTAATTMIAACLALGSVWLAPLFIGAAATLLNPRSASVLSRRYRAVVEATPFISDSNRRKHASDTRRLIWITAIVVIAGTSLLAIFFRI